MELTEKIKKDLLQLEHIKQQMICFNKSQIKNRGLTLCSFSVMLRLVSPVNIGKPLSVNLLGQNTEKLSHLLDRSL